MGLAGKPLYNTSISTQNHSETDEKVGLEGAAGDGKEEDIVFDMQAGHDPSEFVITVNIETSTVDSGVVLRYWTDHVTDQQIEEVADTMTQVLKAFISRPGQLVANIDSDNEGGDAPDSKESQIKPDDKSFQAELAKFASALGFDEVRNDDLNTDASEDEGDEEEQVSEGEEEYEDDESEMVQEEKAPPAPAPPAPAPAPPPQQEVTSRKGKQTVQLVSKASKQQQASESNRNHALYIGLRAPARLVRCYARRVSVDDA